MIFDIFPYLFYHGFFIGDCSKFCVKKMKSTVEICVRGNCHVGQGTNVSERM